MMNDNSGAKAVVLGRNLILSIVIHAAVFTAALAFVVERGPKVRVPVPAVYVTLISEATSHPDGHAGREVDGPAEVKSTSRTATGRHAPPPASAKPPDAAVKEAAPPAGERSDASKKGADLLESGQPQGFNVITSGPPAGGGSGTAQGEGGSGPLTAGRSISAAGSGGAGGSADTVGIIRAAIERAKDYPSPAKKRGLEGTAIAEFTINGKGLPENLKIIRSSGSDILDAAARATIVRASPFPVISGTLEIPIVYRLERGR